mgnify:CR=1 FL=1|jgi:hypothetical protein|tara:strand:- start:232 stop:483 length:252 start_codon:yes stop_codon:yes gene_type:complete
MIKYEIAVLERMIEHYTKNIEMFSTLSPTNAVLDSMAEMVANRRLVASFIENDGVPTVPVGWRNGDVFFDGMVNAAASGVEIF